MKCPHCQADNPEGVKFCGEYGKPIKGEIKYSNFGKPKPSNISISPSTNSAR
jgi:hypothetical protein